MRAQRFEIAKANLATTYEIPTTVLRSDNDRMAKPPGEKIKQVTVEGFLGFVSGLIPKSDKHLFIYEAKK